MNKEHEKVKSPYEKIFIIGFSGAGKTTLSTELATLLTKHTGETWQDLDLDTEIFLRHKVSTETHLGEVIERISLKKFREIESMLLADFCKNLPDKKILALGGGAVSLEFWNEISKHPKILVVFLNTSFDLCYERIKDDPTKPLAKLGRSGLFELYQDRLSLYEKAPVKINSFDIDFIVKLFAGR